MKTHTVAGGRGLELHVQETGNPAGKSILFIHGFSQCRLVWNKQLHSDLARDFRMVTMDIRGHGLSEKPRGVYGDPQVWADDVQAVIVALGLDMPVLSGWSYGGVIVSDYVAVHGEAAIAGTHWVGAISRLGEPLVRDGFLGADFLALVPAFCSDSVVDSVDGLARLLRLCTHAELPAEDFCLFLGHNVLVPPFVREALLARSLDNDAVVARMRKPMLLTHGEDDAIVAPAMGRHLAALANGQAVLSTYPAVGHMPFWEAPERFNAELRAFRERV